MLGFSSIAVGALFLLKYYNMGTTVTTEGKDSAGYPGYAHLYETIFYGRRALKKSSKKIAGTILMAILLATTAHAGISHERKMQVWRYYIRAEDAYGMDRAEAMTAKKFGISKKQVLDVKVEANTKMWPLPEEEGLPPEPYKSEAQRQKENSEFGAELYRQAEKVRQRGY